MGGTLGPPMLRLPPFPFPLRGVSDGMLLPRFAVALAACSLVLAGCRSATRPTPPRPGEPRAMAEPAARAPRWIVTHASSARTHDLHVTATLVSRVDSLERVDTLRATARTTWTFSPAPIAAAGVPARISGSLVRYAVGLGGEGELSPPPGLPLPFVYAAEQASPGEMPQLTLPRPDDCGGGAAAVAALRELWISPPDTLFVGRTWTDSARYLTCRDSVPLSVETERRFTVVGAERRGDAPVVLIERQSASRMSGSGTQFGEPLDITAEGSGTMLLSLALDGQVIGGEGEAVLRMEMRGRRRAQQLEQRARITIVTP